MRFYYLLPFVYAAVAAAVSKCDTELPCDGSFDIPAANLTKRASLDKRGPTAVLAYKTWKIHTNNCWSDTVGHMRGLDCPASGISSDSMTVETCLDACESQGYSLAGLEWSQECFCGNTMIGQNRPIADSNCNQGCKGNGNQLCGGSAALNLYVRNNYQFTMGPAAVVQSYNGWNTPVCMKDPDASFRLLPGKPEPQVDPKSMTVQKCIDACGAQGYSFAGLEYGRECYCGTNAPSSSSVAPNADCDNPCLGDGSSICGGRNRVLVYSKAQSVTQRGIIQVINKSNSAVLGFISKNSFNGAQLRYQPAESDALAVTFQTPASASQIFTQLQISMGPNDLSSPNTLLGLIQGRDDTNSVLSTGSYHYVYFSGTNPTPQGSGPVAVGNSYSTTTGLSRTSESAVWIFDPSTNDLSAKWLNPDGNPPTFEIFSQSTALYAGGDMASFNNRYPSTVTPIRFKFIPKA